ncbi:hypothetical protein GCM10009001_25390 [Virgibacillus siamensis]|uniref:PrcB C-terminal domain-containing protein n=1 Tax=Virgibacillus siamensis TaxID=480071 RepID=A0ABN1G9Q9_9BACI
MSDKLAFQKTKVDAAPDNVQEWIRQNRSKQQNKVFRENGKTYVVILLGQKTTGGYNVEMEQIRRAKTENGNSINLVSYSVTEPEQGSINIQVLTYPMAIAVLDGEVKGEFQFKRKKNGEK